MLFITLFEVGKLSNLGVYRLMKTSLWSTVYVEKDILREDRLIHFFILLPHGQKCCILAGPFLSLPFLFHEVQCLERVSFASLGDMRAQLEVPRRANQKDRQDSYDVQNRKQFTWTIKMESPGTCGKEESLDCKARKFYVVHFFKKG